jgi:hypothetical protein
MTDDLPSHYFNFTHFFTYKSSLSNSRVVFQKFRKHTSMSSYFLQRGDLINRFGGRNQSRTKGKETGNPK